MQKSNKNYLFNNSKIMTDQAQKEVLKGRQMEANKIASGAKWIRQGKTLRLVKC